MPQLTKRKYAARALIEKARLAEQIASAAAAAPGAIYAFRQSADGRQSIPYASANWRRVFGFAPEDVRRDARPILDRIHFDDLRRINASVAESARTLTRWRGEFRFDHPERGVVWLEGQSTPVPHLNGDMTWHGYVHDVSERRKSAARIEKLCADRLNAIGQTAAGLAHQINQPLSASAIYLKTARRVLQKRPELGAAGVEDLADILNRAGAEVMRAAQMLSRLGQFAAPEASDKTSQNLHELIEEACGLTAGGATKADVRVTLHLSAEHDQILADKAQILHTIVNLIRNAIEAMHASQKRELTITTSRVDEDMIRTDVVDTGVGLSEHISSLFEPWMTTKANRSGVGLAISRSIVEGHYGRIWVASNPEGGCVFSFTLPLAEPAISFGL
jgi:C4-dicarboxylate-specific signal transduction histidine kinase